MKGGLCMPGTATKNSRRTVQKSKVTFSYYTVQDVMVILGCKRTKAQDAIRELNDELVQKGYMRYPRGRVPKKYFDERHYL